MRILQPLPLLKCLSLIMVCALMWRCGPSKEELEKRELALYNDVLDQLAWQSEEACRADGLRAIFSSKQRGDTLKNLLKARADKSVLYYQPRIGAPRKSSSLADWIEVEVSSWERFSRTFSGTTAKAVKPSLAVSSSLDVARLHVDYMNIAKLDTTSTVPDSSMAVIRFSQPFYHKERNRAVLYFESACGPAKARGELLMLRLKDNRWMIEERRSVWIR